MHSLLRFASFLLVSSLALLVSGLVSGSPNTAAAQTITPTQTGDGICMMPEPPASSSSSPSLVTGGRSPEIVGAYPGTAAFADSVHALVVLVHFSDDDAATTEWPIQSDFYGEILPVWGADLVVEDPAQVNAALSLNDPSLSAYFYHQSANGSTGPHVFTGEVWPKTPGGSRVYVPQHPSGHYKSSESSGYGYLVQEILDNLTADPAFDIRDFDANHDGELDHLMLAVRQDPAVNVIGGIASLRGGTGGTRGAPSSVLYYSEGGDTIAVDMNDWGSGAITWTGGSNARKTLIHEYGHVAFGGVGHTYMLGPSSPFYNDVPFDVPTGGGRLACAYNRMCGASPSSNYDGNVTLSGFEIRRMGWENATVLNPGLDYSGVTAAPLYSSGDVILVPLRQGSGADTLSFENRQRTNYFDDYPDWAFDDPYLGNVKRDLVTEGLLATLSQGAPDGRWVNYRYDFAPPSNRFGIKSEAGGNLSRCDGRSPNCTDSDAPWEGDMLEPRPAAGMNGNFQTQMTPWTRPNVSGYTLYPRGFEPNWFAITNVRYTGRGREMAFDFVSDFRSASNGQEILITANSWMGQETATSSGGSSFTFTNPVRLTDGSQLRVWENSTIVFAGGLTIEDGSELICEGGSTCIVSGEALATGSGSCILAESGATVRIAGTFRTRAGGFYAVETGASLDLVSNAQIVIEPGSAPILLQPGSRHRLGSAAAITYGAQVNLVGTASAPIRFQRMTFGVRWSEVRLEGDNSILRHVVLDGGRGNLWVQADNVNLDYVTSRNGEHGLRTHFEADLSTAANLRVTNGLFENAAYYGLYFYATNAVVQNTVVRRSGYNNVSLYFATVSGFGGNTVENGVDAGVAVSESSFSFGYSSPGPGARNRIRNNAGHEVYVASGGSAFLGTDTFVFGGNGGRRPSSGACNAITSTGGYAGSKLIYNATSQTVSAMFNWWGSSSPPASSYYGPVIYDDALPSDPTAGGACEGEPGGGAPSGEPGPAMTTHAGASSRTGATDPDARSSSPQGAPDPQAAAHQGPSPEEVAAMAERMVALRDSLSGATGDVRDLVAELATVVRADPGDATGQWAANVAALTAVAEPLDGGRPDHAYSAELAALSLAREALARSEASEARALFDRYAQHVTLPEYRRSLLGFESGLLAVEGRPGEALTRLVAYETAEQAHALVTEGYEAPDLSFVRQALAEAAGQSPSGVQSAALAATATALDGERLVTGLGSPYPNPTRDGVSVALTLAQAGR